MGKRPGKRPGLLSVSGCIDNRLCKPIDLRPRLLLDSLEESEQRHARHLHDLETDSGDISHGVSGTSESSNEHLVVLLDEVQAAITGHEGSDLLAVLDQLHTHALADSGVRLLGLNSELLQHDALGVGSTTEGVRLELGAKVLLLVALVGPLVLAPAVAELAACADSRWLTAELVSVCLLARPGHGMGVPGEEGRGGAPALLSTVPQLGLAQPVSLPRYNDA